MNIESLSEFIEWAAQFNDGQYLFRGVSKDCYKIEASAYRRLETNKTAARLLKVNQELIEEAKSRGHDQKNSQRLFDLELLAELQHFGAATCLIDFSRNALIALWFACQPNSTKEEANGKVFAVRSDNPVRFKTITPDLIEKKIDYFFNQTENDYPLYQWEPKLQNNRILAQHSTFVFGGDQIESEVECVIMQSSKQEILKSLSQLSDITEASMFPDFDGFARLHAHYKPYIEPDARDHLQRGIEAYQKRELDDAIAYYTKAIELDPADISITSPAYYNCGLAYYGKGEVERAIVDYTRAIELNPNFDAAYYNRGVVHYEKKAFEHAITDYTRAIELNPNFDAAYNNRGLAYTELRDYNGAINDFDRAIEINPNNANAYNNRGVAYVRQGKYHRAVHDYNRAIELNYVLAYFNRGEALLHLGEWEKAKSDLTTAKEKGVNIINVFRDDHESVAAFEERYDIHLPADIAKMLTPT